ncbi:MAG TPA: NAD(P)H-dependent oxidoreductase [Candidatus Baltobacteraceae bacterium]|nr:NAD(P)H-dependent oxidoreductase [Candidatus Baltobacteraceae bacterium]
MVRMAIINGHPDPSGTRLNDALANRYAEAALATGSEIRRIDIAQIDFPMLRNPDDFYGEPPEAIRHAQRDIEWADHLVFFFPLWCGDMPALLKAFVEQTFRPGFAMDYAGSRGFPKQLLRGRSARIVTTMGMPAFVYRTMFGEHALKAMSLALGMCGISPIRRTLIGGVGETYGESLSASLERVAILARTDGAEDSDRTKPLRTVAAAGLVLGVAAYLAFAAWQFARYGKARGDDALLDRVMPRYEVGVHHEVEIRAAVDVAFEAMQHTDFEQSLVVKALLRAREIILGAAHETRAMPSGLTDQLAAIGWSVIAEDPGRELVFGTVTQPWQPNPVFRPLASAEFAAFDRPGFAKIAFSLRVDPLSPGVAKARTETRVQTTDPLSRARFRRYWALLSPGIDLVRIVLLQQLKAEAESRWGRAHTPIL